MKARILLTASLLTLACGSALAENWSGASIGVTVGGAWHESSGKGASFDDTSPEALNVWAQTNKKHTEDKFTGGVKAAYDWQSGNAVYGVIFDWNYVNADSKSGTLDYGWYSYHREDKMDWLATIRGRVGMDVAGFLPYLTGGLAISDITNIHQTITCCPTLYESNKDDVHFGWTLGAGVEKKINNNFSVTLEGLYADFGSTKGNVTTPPMYSSVYNSQVKLENNVYLLNLGLNYKLK
jgi:outer membrane immunogenic protein